MALAVTEQWPQGGVAIGGPQMFTARWVRTDLVLLVGLLTAACSSSAPTPLVQPTE
jgi:hypothetical protein